VVERELAVQTAKALEENAASAKPKPDQVIHNNIIPGRMKRFLAENTLLGQAFVINPDLTVEQAAKDAGVEITGYARVAVGEGVEKKKKILPPKWQRRCRAEIDCPDGAGGRCSERRPLFHSGRRAAASRRTAAAATAAPGRATAGRRQNRAGRPEGRREDVERREDMETVRSLQLEPHRPSAPGERGAATSATGTAAR
jgi:hypothetical protein